MFSFTSEYGLRWFLEIFVIGGAAFYEGGVHQSNWSLSLYDTGIRARN